MHYSESWIAQSVEVLNGRAIKPTNFYSGRLVLIRGSEENQHIDLIQGNDGIHFFTVKPNLVSYQKLANATSIKERMKIFINAVRDIDFYFAVDKNLVELVIYGYDNDDEE